MGNSCFSFLGRLFGENYDHIQAPLPASDHLSRSSSTSDDARKTLLLRRPANSSAQFRTAHDQITQQFPNFSNLQSSLILESPHRPSKIFIAENLTTRKLNSATDAARKSTCQASSSISPVPPFEKVSDRNTQKRESSSLDRRNDNLSAGKRPMESSFTGTGTTSVPSFRELQKLNPANHSAQKSCQVSSSMLQLPPSQTSSSILPVPPFEKVTDRNTQKRELSSLDRRNENLSAGKRPMELSFTGTETTSVPSFRELQKLNPASHSAQKSCQVSASMLQLPPSQTSSSISPVPPFEKVSDRNTQKRELSSLDRRNENLSAGKRPMELSFTGTETTSVPSFGELQKLNPASHSAHKSCQISVSMLPVPPSQTVLKLATEKHRSNSFVQTYVNLPSSKKTLEPPFISSTPSMPNFKDTERLGNVALGKKGQTNFSSNSSSLFSDTSSSSSDSSPLYPTKADVEKVMTSDSPKQSTGTNSKFIWRVKSKNLPANKSSYSSLLDEPTFSSPALKPKVTLPVFKVPDNLEHELENGKIPRILLTSLSIFTYREYFTALMYAEDYYCQKWSDYLLKDVALDIRENLISNKNKKVTAHDYQFPNIGKKEKFVVFEIDSIRERRPFLLSRDFVHLKPLHEHKQFKSFDGVVLRVANRSFVHTKFGDDFYSQHTPTSRYDVSFSFNRVCLKRCHSAINAITDFTFNSFLFPDHSTRILDTDQDQETFSFYNCALNYKEKVAVQHILNLWCPPPYLLVGPLAISMPSSNINSSPFELSTTGRVVKEAILRIYRADTESRLLIATPRNKTCDVIMQGLTNHIPAHQLFRANAAFRGVEDVPDDILDLTTYNPGEECFAMTDLPDLLKFRVISTTFMSSFRLYNEGVKAGHFSHLFLVDASSAIEPEVLVPLVNLVDEMTVVVVTGAMGDCPHRIRSDISQKYGLKISYFERLLRSSLYSSKDPSFVSYL